MGSLIPILVVKEKVQEKQISIEHIETESMLADPLTKGLTPKVFHEHTARMGVTIDDILFSESYFLSICFMSDIELFHFLQNKV